MEKTWGHSLHSFPFTTKIFSIIPHLQTNFKYLVALLLCITITVLWGIFRGKCSSVKIVQHIRYISCLCNIQLKIRNISDLWKISSKELNGEKTKEILLLCIMSYSVFKWKRHSTMHIDCILDLVISAYHGKCGLKNRHILHR